VRRRWYPGLTATLVIVVCACLLLNIWIRLPESDPDTPTASRQEAGPVAGVILAGPAPDYGWYDRAHSAPPYAAVSLNGYSVLLLDRYATTRTADRSLDAVIADMHARGAYVIFLSPGIPIEAEEAARFEKLAPATLVLNRADRASVAAILPAFIPGQSSSPIIASTTSSAEQGRNEEDRDQDGVVIAVFALLVIVALVVRNSWHTLRSALQRRRDSR